MPNPDYSTRLGQYVPFPLPMEAITDDPSTGTLWSLCFSENWTPAIIGALKTLCRPETWSGTDADVETSVQNAQTLLGAIKESCGVGEIGTIIAYATTSPPAGTLACDGATYLRVDYPALYALLASAFITDADHFVVPDLRGRTVLGTGQGSGLTNRVMNASGGEEVHTLLEAEIPAHQHTEYGAVQNSPWGRRQESYLTGAGGNPHTYEVLQETIRTDNGIIDALTTGSIGSGSSHNNMQPWRALGYAIIAL